MKIADLADQLLAFLKETSNISQYKIERINLNSQTQWSIQNGILSHKSKGFFHVTGLIDKNRKENVVLYQPQSALTGLAIHRSKEKVYILVQARVEPGNTGLAQFGPTIQSTPGNYMRMHGGKKLRISNCFSIMFQGVQPYRIVINLI